MDPTADNPFLDDIFVDQPDALPGVEGIHREAFERISAAVESLARPRNPPDALVALGRIFLVAATGSGFGKTHLVARIREGLAGTASSLALPFDRSRPATWPVALASVLRQFSPAGMGAGVAAFGLLDEVSRFFLSRLVLETLACGSMNPRDCPEEPMRLQSEFATLFSRDSDSRILGWVDKRASDLVKCADPGFSRRLGLGPSELAFWTRLFVDLNLREEGALDRLRGLSNGEARERLLQLLRIATDLRPVLAVADGLDGFHRSDAAGMEVAEIATGIRERVPRSVVLLCVNDDLWESAFAARLPQAWIDRLDIETVRLHPIAAETATELVRRRLGRLRLPESEAADFAGRLAEKRHWSEADEPLTPRRVLREAAELWREEAAKPFGRREGAEPDPFEPVAWTATAEDFSGFDALPRGEDRVTPRAVSSPIPPPLPEGWRFSTPPTPAATKPAPDPAPAADPAPEPEPRPAPVTASPPPPPPKAEPRSLESDLAAIDSIINDIRGSGKTVVSEAPERPLDLATTGAAKKVAGFDAEGAQVGPAAAESAMPAPAPETESKFEPEPVVEASAQDPVPAPSSPDSARKANEPPRSFFTGFTPDPPRATPFGGAGAPLNRASFERAVAEREDELLSGPGLVLDLERLAKFVGAVGSRHPALAQKEERYPSSRSACLRWNGHGHSVVVGFESPRNAYFWNNLLQQSLASNRQEKIVGFSHPSEPFDPALFAGFGYSPAVVRARVDIIEMNDRELAMVLATERTLREHESGADGEKACQFAILRLDPLWRRIVQPL